MDWTSDPLLRLLPSEPPASFTNMPDDEQRWRGKAFLALWGMGAPEHFCWGIALQTIDPDQAGFRADIEAIPDDMIRQEVIARIAAINLAAKITPAGAR